MRWLAPICCIIALLHKKMCRMVISLVVFYLFIEVKKSFAMLKHIYGFLLLNLFDSNLDCPDSVGKMFGNNLKN